MNVLIACEESQRVCMEFRALGHEAYSCDIVECSGGHPEWHIQEDVLPTMIEEENKFDPYDETQVDLSGIANAPVVSE